MYLFLTSKITKSDLGLRLFILSWTTYDFDGNPIDDRKEYLFKPTDFTISETLQFQTNISQEQALQFGEYSYTILKEFEKSIKKATLIIAFNIELQLSTILNEFYINGLGTDDIDLKPRQCLQSGLNVVNYCNSVGCNSRSLESLHYSLFWDNDCPSEMNCLIKCFFQLLRKKYI